MNLTITIEAGHVKRCSIMRWVGTQLYDFFFFFPVFSFTIISLHGTLA